MSDREDKRYQQAEVRIREAFLTLMEEKSFEGMTATDIIKRADVNRTTFYCHYRDKFELLDVVENEFWEPLAEYISRKTGSELTEAFFHDTIHEIVAYYDQNREKLRLLTKKNNDPHYWDKFSNKFQKVFMRIFEVNQISIPEAYALSAFVAMISSILMTWVSNDFRESPEELSEITFRIFSGIPERIFGERGKS